MISPIEGMQTDPITTPAESLCLEHDSPIQYLCQKHASYLCKHCLYDHANHVNRLIPIFPSN